ncbi:hypothetical protein PR003_g27371 [Phytophthora rubi]|uniref:Uncharacterized protein n=1 Tax=Phytophthora rubi TaxID=129364 RepID=A0A6A4C0W5_9STRA|nr:hypothetical protein PR003_g27371 [Phytophthora rubi]
MQAMNLPSSRVKEDGPLPDALEGPTRHVLTEAEQSGLDVVPSRLAPRSDTQDLTPESTTAQASRIVITLIKYARSDSSIRNDGPTVAQVKTYVAGQVRRWERVTTEFVASPTTEYS